MANIPGIPEWQDYIEGVINKVTTGFTGMNGLLQTIANRLQFLKDNQDEKLDKGAGLSNDYDTAKKIEDKIEVLSVNPVFVEGGATFYKKETNSLVEIFGTGLTDVAYNFSAHGSSLIFAVGMHRGSTYSTNIVLENGSDINSAEFKSDSGFPSIECYIHIVLLK